MKKLGLLIILIINVLLTFAQIPGLSQRSSGMATLADPNLFVTRSLKVPVFNDTLQANNAFPHLDSAGMIIYTLDVRSYWQRDIPPRKWTRVSDSVLFDNTTFITTPTSYGANVSNRFASSISSGTVTSQNYIDWYNKADVGSAWGITGNSGTDPSTDFIGTTDKDTLIFKVNNSVAGYFDNMGVNTFLGVFANNGNRTGSYNTGIGGGALFNNTTGSENTSVGASSIIEDSVGSRNTAIGAYAMNTTLGTANTAIGDSAMYGTGGSGRGNYNTAIGVKSLMFSSGNVGNYNTVLGAYSDVIPTAINATAIGANAFAGANNSLILGSINGVNGATSSVNVGIGTTTPDSTLTVVGGLLLNLPSKGAGKVLTSSATGAATWESPAGGGNTIYTGDGTITDATRTVTGDELIFATNEVYFNHQTFSDTTWANTSYHNDIFLDHEFWTGAQGALLVYDSASTFEYFEASPINIKGQDLASSIAYFNASNSFFQLKDIINSGHEYLFADGNDQGIKFSNSITNTLYEQHAIDGSGTMANGNITWGTGGALKIADGTQATGYVFTSDASGNATWQTPSTVAAAGALIGTTLASNVVSSSLTSVGTLGNLTVTNPITGSITGNAATVTTNANLTGPITSVGNATSIASQTGTGTTFVMSVAQTMTGQTTTDSINTKKINIASIANNTPRITTGYSLTGSNPAALDSITGTVNTTGSPSFLKMNITNTASGASTKMVEYLMSGNNVFNISKNGYAVFGNTADGVYVGSATASTGVVAVAGTAMVLGSKVANTVGYDYWFVPGNTRGNTSGTNGGVNITGTFSPASGTGTYTNVYSKLTVNGSGGASGITRNIFIDDVLTAAADHRAFEISNNSGYAIYQSGTSAKNLLSGGIVGTATNNNATTGNIGEEFNSTVSTYTNFTTTATYQNIASITLTAGDWDLSAFFTYSSNSATITAASNAIFVISTTTASASGATEGQNINYVPQAALLGTSKFTDVIGPYRVSLSGTTTYYLNTQATFTLGNPQYVGSIRARRMR